MKLLSLSKNNATTTTTATTPTTLARSSSWPWQAYCHQPKTLSFRGVGKDLFRTVNSAFIEDDPNLPPDPPEQEGFEDKEEDESIETVIRGARSEGRIFFEPVGETSSVLAVELEEEHVVEDHHELGDGVAMCVLDSRDPYRDFRSSMEEMVEARALRSNWDSLEDLLRCYLRVNDRTNHAYILRAFVDLLLSSTESKRNTRAFTDDSKCSCNCSIAKTGNGDEANNVTNPPSTSSPCSPLSFYTSQSSCCSSSDSLSTTPCCISVIGEAEENGISSGSVSIVGQQHRLPSSLKLAEQNRGGDPPPENRGGDDCSSSMASSSSYV